MQGLRAVDSWKLSAAYLFVVALLLIATAMSMRSRDADSPRYGLSARQSNTIGVQDVLTSVRSGRLGNFGIALLMLVGPTAETFETSSALFSAAALLLVTAIALFRHRRIGALAGAVWAGVALALSAVMLTQISISYSFGTRLFMFAPAAACNLVLLIALGRKLRCASELGVRSGALTQNEQLPKN